MTSSSKFTITDRPTILSCTCALRKSQVISSRCCLPACCATATIVCLPVSHAFVLSPVHPSSSFCMKSLSFLPIVVLLSMPLLRLRHFTADDASLQRHLSADVRCNPSSIEHVSSSVLVFISVARGRLFPVEQIPRNELKLRTDAVPPRNKQNERIVNSDQI